MTIISLYLYRPANSPLYFDNQEPPPTPPWRTGRLTTLGSTTKIANTDQTKLGN
jgi:hypothetical protein